MTIGEGTRFMSRTLTGTCLTHHQCRRAERGPATSRCSARRPRDVPVKASAAGHHVPHGDVLRDTTSPMGTTKVVTVRVGYARCSTDAQDLEVQRQALAALGVTP
jgi:hypothetical protein